jgi:hypothetical protein
VAEPLCLLALVPPDKGFLTRSAIILTTCRIDPESLMKNLKSARRLVSVALIAGLLVGANLFLTHKSKPFQRLDSYQTATELIQDKNWNWGLAFVMSFHHGAVTLKNLGDYTQNGFFIPEELGVVNGLTLDTSASPIVLSPEQAAALKATAGNKVEISKTRCLGRLVKYCEVRILSNKNINDKPETFVGVLLSPDVYGLVEQKLLETVTGSVN